VVVCVCWDVTDKRRNEDRLAFMAGHDPLTGLPNRRSFQEALERATARRGRGTRATVVMLDMDHLKELNDAEGHLEGDQALVNLAMLLRRHIRAEDMPARLGGDEFAVLLEDTSTADAAEIAERIREAAYSDNFTPHARTHGVGVSAGIVELDSVAGPSLTLDRADAALYSAKENGRNQVVVWSPSIVMRDSETLKGLVWEAFSQDGFVLAYQPVISLGDGSIAYFESLTRLKGPDGELIGPGHFLPVVERLGLMSRLTLAVLKLALAELSDVSGYSVSVNLSGSDLADAGLLDDVAEVIGGARYARGRLLFEISEDDLLSNLAGGKCWMDRLSALGCRFVLDDFGSGVGMFLLLREPHIGQVKLSRTIMRSVVAEKTNRDFVRALRELIETQGKSAVASYLESAELVDDARDSGFSWGQGFSILEPQVGLALAVDQVDGDMHEEGAPRARKRESGDAKDADRGR
jgi:diguanylate cyclase (GGDEF)-like protein